MIVWNETTPRGGDPISSLDEVIRDLKAAVNERVSVSHTSLGSDVAEHKSLIVGQSGAPDVYHLRARASTSEYFRLVERPNFTEMCVGVKKESPAGGFSHAFDAEPGSRTTLTFNTRGGVLVKRYMPNVVSAAPREACSWGTRVPYIRGSVMTARQAGWLRLWPQEYNQPPYTDIGLVVRGHAFIALKVVAIGGPVAALTAVRVVYEPLASGQRYVDTNVRVLKRNLIGAMGVLFEISYSLAYNGLVKFAVEVYKDPLYTNASFRVYRPTLFCVPGHL